MKLALSLAASRSFNPLMLLLSELVSSFHGQLRMTDERHIFLVESEHVDLALFSISILLYKIAIALG